VSDDASGTHAVLVLIGRVEGTARLLLTQRASALRSHPGSIALPGGRREDSEAPEATALREASEEVGLDPGTVEVLGRGPLVRMPPDGVEIVPVFARWRRPHPLNGSAEVSRVLLVRVAELLDEQNLRRFESPDGRCAWAWQLADGLVWGVTALMVELLLNETFPGWADGRDPRDLPADRVVREPAAGPDTVHVGEPAAGPDTVHVGEPAAAASPGAQRVHAGHLLAAQLVTEGIQEVFTLIGGHISPVFDGCARRGIRLIDVRHEAAAVHAADGLARLRRAPQVAAVTAGPGLTNAITAVANAWYAQSPVIVLSGRNPLSLEGLGTLQDGPHVELLRPVTKRAETAYDGYRLAELLHWSITAATAPRSGPTLLDLPLDVQLTPVPADDEASLPGRCRFTAPPGPDPDEVAAVARLLAGARHPVVLAGSSAYWSGAEDALQAFAAVLRGPVYCNGLARGMLPPGHPNALRLTRSAALRGADAVVVLGADFDFRLGYGRGAEFAPGVPVVHVDPQPDRIGHTRPVQYGVVSDVRLFLQALTQLDGKYAGVTDADWLPSLRAEEDRRHARRLTMLDADQVPIHPMRFVAEVARFADRDAVFVADGGDVAAMAASVLEPALPAHWLDTGPFGCLGVGIPFAMAARVAYPSAQVLAVLGDGAFGFNAMELDSAVRQRLPFVAAVGNDGAWGEMRTFHELLFGPDHREGQYLSLDARYDKVAQALGGYGERVDRPEQIAPALARAADSGAPAVVYLVLDRSYRHQGNTAGAATALRGLATPG